MILRPLPAATKDNCVKYSGLVTSLIADDENGDIVIRLKNDNNYYYINRGIDQGISLSELENKLTNKPVELLAIKYWTPLAPRSGPKHIARITAEGGVVYNEIKEN
jgi:hypothetical protein